MKKLVSLFIALVLALGCVVPAFADMDGPFFLNYEAVIINPNGAEFSRWFNSKQEEITIPSGTVVMVTGEYEDKGQTEAFCTYGQYSGTVLLSDIAKLNEKVGPEKAYKLKTPQTRICVNEKGAPIRKGPSESYDEIGRIPYKTKLKIDYVVNSGGADDGFGPDYSWSYITYNGVTGWVDTMQMYQNYDFVTSVDDNLVYTGEVLTLEDVRLTAKPDRVDEYNDNYYISGKIPKNTTLYFEYLYNGIKDNYAFVEYNGAKGWLYLDECLGYTQDFISSTVVGKRGCVIAMDKSGVKLYTEPLGKGSFTGKTLPYNEIAVFDMMAENSYETGEYDCIFEETFRVTVDGVTGWVTTIDTSPSLAFNVGWHGGLAEFIAKREIFVYSEPNVSSEIIATIQNGGKYFEIFYSYGSDFDYVKYGKTTGWVCTDPDDYDYDWTHEAKFSSVDEFVNCIQSASEEITVSVEETTDEMYYGEFTVEETLAGEVSPDDEGSEQSPAKSMKKWVFVCIALAVVIAAGAVFEVVRLNKKKENRA